MLRRRVNSTVPAARVRHYNVPGWRTMVPSSGGAKSREQRDADRRKRQLEKLPAPIPLHDLQYPMERSVLCDQHFQPPVYQNNLDTPGLFNTENVHDFFVAWNAGDACQPAYPPLPEIDHRKIDPSEASWKDHVAVVRDYAAKHSISPAVLPRVTFDANLVAVFGSERSAKDDFWVTSHCGNFIELAELQSPPALSIRSATHERFTVLMVSPDYPWRGEGPQEYMLHYAACNVVAGTGTCGDAIISYVPPLPTEDAGVARVMCIAYPQRGPVAAPASEDLPLEQRRRFRLHDGLPESTALRMVDDIADVPSCVTWFTTAWDIQVQEWYEGHGLPEPMYHPDDLLRLAEYSALPRDHFKIKSRTDSLGRQNRRGDVVELHQGGYNKPKEVTRGMPVSAITKNGLSLR